MAHLPKHRRVLRSETVKLRVQPELKDQLRERARAADRTMSDWASLQLAALLKNGTQRRKSANV